MKNHTNSRGMLVALSLAVAGLSAPAISAAGPGCMHDPRMTRGFYPHSPMAPPAAYRQTAPYAYQGAPAPYAGNMAAPRYPAQNTRQGVPAARATPAVPATGGTEEDTQVAAGSSETAAANAVTVRMSGMRFEPASITVTPGTRVTWVQGDRMPHVISGTASGMRSNTLYAGQEYSYIFQEPGSYDYVCDLHPSMQGRIVVEAAGTDT